jgi:hypothetical protein
VPSLSDHTRRDAEHAARMAISVELSRYKRRMEELAKSHIKEAIEEATNNGNAIDGTALGQAAGAQSISAYIGAGEPQPAIEAAGQPTDD